MSETVASTRTGSPRSSTARSAGRARRPADSGNPADRRARGRDPARRRRRLRRARAPHAPPSAAGRRAGARPRPRDRAGRAARRGNKRRSPRLVTREIGKPYAESLGEVQEIIDTCDFFLGEGRRLYGQTVPSEMPDKQLFTFRTPVGVAAIVTAGNFPVAVPSWYLVPAILCGNAVVWKPAEYARGDRRRARPALPRRRRARRRAQARPGGRARDVRGPPARARARGSSTRSASPAPRAVGAKIGALCGRNLQSPCLELGGKNLLVVMEDADLDLAVEGALFAGFGTAGQRCTSLGTAIVQAGVHDEFVRRLDARLRAAPIGDPTQDVLYGPMLARALRRALRGLARADPRPPHAARLHRLGRITASSPRDGFVGDPEAGLFYHPTFVTGVTAEDDLYATETFGPLIGVVPLRDVRRGDGAGQRPRLRAVIGDLHDLADARLPVPRADQRGHGLDQQLDLRRRGAPALRRQRQVGQRLAPVRHLGARPVHALAVGELGLRGQAAEGADGRRRRSPRTRASGSRRASV